MATFLFKGKRPEGVRFTQIPNSLVRDRVISAEAKELYNFLYSFKDEKLITNAFICRELGISQTSLTRVKAELTKKDLLLTVQIQPRIFVTYIGTLEFTASQMKLHYASTVIGTLK